MMTRRQIALLAAGMTLLAGCPEETVSHTRIVKEPDTTARPAAPLAPPAPPAAGPMGAMNGEVPAPPKPSGAAKLEWTLPKGWTQTLTGGIRFATLTAPEGHLDISVVVLAGQAGGELANVNRWRSQIGLPPLGEESLPAARKSLTTKVGPISVYDFTSEGVQKGRMVVGLVQSDDNTWFFKMTGGEPDVANAVPDFMSLLRSLHSQAGAN
jgi:hypothetical protein